MFQKLSLSTLALGAAFLLSAEAAHAARGPLMTTTRSLKPGELTLAIGGGIAGPSGTAFGVTAHEGVGLMGGVDLYLEQGWGFHYSREFYFGGGVKYTLANGGRGKLGFAVLGGGHYWGGYGGLDITALADSVFGKFRPYLGLGGGIDFGYRAEAYISVVGGTRIAIKKNIYWFVDGSVTFVGGPAYYIHTGPRIFI